MAWRKNPGLVQLAVKYRLLFAGFKDSPIFIVKSNGEKIEQTGIVRSNCIDCLDRTNVTQILENQLRQIGALGDDETISAHQQFDSCFKILWANHGDDVSIQYSGTPALKEDFVRYGRWTIQGILNDGWNSLARYYLNNFADGSRQDSIDLVHGHYIVSISRDTTTSQIGGLQALASFKLASALVLAGMFFAIISLRQVPGSLRVVCGSLSLFIAAFVRARGRMFTSRPRLLKSHHPSG